jgi:hypothetical protein
MGPCRLSLVSIGDDSHIVALAQAFAQGIQQGRFARAYRPADADFDTGVWVNFLPLLNGPKTPLLGKLLGRLV